MIFVGGQLAISGTSNTTRKFCIDKLKAEDLVNYGSLTQTIADFLQGCVTARFNIVISGGTGSGTTTLLNVMSGFIPENVEQKELYDSSKM